MGRTTREWRHSGALTVSYPPSLDFQAHPPTSDVSAIHFRHSLLSFAPYAYTYIPIVILTKTASLVLDHPAQVWWRWMNIFFTLVLWAIELLVSDDDPVAKEWKVE